MRLTSQRNTGQLLVMPTAPYVCVTPRKPDLFKLSNRVAFEALPQCGLERGSGLVHGQGLERMLDLARDLCVCEFPCRECMLAPMTQHTESRTGGTY